MGIIQSLFSSPLVKAKALKWLRWASTSAGAVTLTWTFNFLSVNMKSFSTADDASIATVVSTAVAGLILSIGGAVYSMIDANNVDAKITIAAATGSTAQANDPVAVRSVKAASGSPEALQEAISALKGGEE